MSVAFVAALTPSGWGYGGGPITSPSFTPTNAGDQLIGFWQNETAGTTMTYSGTGTYTNLSGNFTDTVNDVWGAAINTSATAGAQTATVTSSGGYSFPFASLLEYSGVASESSLTGVDVVNPGTGTGAIQGTAQSVPSGGVLIAICYSFTNSTPGLSVAGGGTQRDTNASPQWIWAEYAGGGTVTPSFTATGGATNSFGVIQFSLNPPVSAPSDLHEIGLGLSMVRLGGRI